MRYKNLHCIKCKKSLLNKVLEKRKVTRRIRFTRVRTFFFDFLIRRSNGNVIVASGGFEHSPEPVLHSEQKQWSVANAKLVVARTSVIRLTRLFFFCYVRRIVWKSCHHTLAKPSCFFFQSSASSDICNSLKMCSKSLTSNRYCKYFKKL